MAIPPRYCWDTKLVFLDKLSDFVLGYIAIEHWLGFGSGILFVRFLSAYAWMTESRLYAWRRCLFCWIYGSDT